MEEVKKRGRPPRKLREETTTAIAYSNSNSTGNYTTTGTLATGEVSFKEEKATADTDPYGWLIPWDGNKDNLKPGEAKFFLNGKKLLYVLKKKMGVDDSGNPVYKIMRGMKAFVNDKRPEGLRIKEILRKRGVAYIGV